MDTVTIQKYTKFRGFCSPKPLIGQNHFFGIPIQNVHVAARQMTYFASKSAQ